MMSQLVIVPKRLKMISRSCARAPDQALLAFPLTPGMKQGCK
jgi:hypothetical protein